VAQEAQPSLRRGFAGAEGCAGCEECPPPAPCSRALLLGSALPSAVLLAWARGQSELLHKDRVWE